MGFSLGCMTEKSIEFWYEFASTYSYPAAMRVERLAAASGVIVRCKPFLLGPILAAQGMKDSPFNIYAVRGRYMWRDLERICAAENIPLKHPSRFPQFGLKAARLALIGADRQPVGQAATNWCPAFSRAVFTANFAEDKDITQDDVLADILRNIGVDPQAAFAAANTAENKDRLKRQTDEAMERGIFGAPSMLIGEELFWGNDRLHEAIDWAAR